MTASSIRRWPLSLALTAGVLLGPAAATAQETKTSDGVNAAVQRAPGKQQLIASGDTPDLLLLYTGDVIGYVDPCG